MGQPERKEGSFRGSSVIKEESNISSKANIFLYAYTKYVSLSTCAIFFFTRMRDIFFLTHMRNIFPYAHA